MGKKKSRAVKIMKAAPLKVAKTFDCPFCSHTQSIEVKLRRPLCKATLMCRICKVSYEMRLLKIQKEVDVYCSWIDKCEEANNERRFGPSNEAAAKP
jgi:transcription elongation factor Elf1